MAFYSVLKKDWTMLDAESRFVNGFLVLELEAIHRQHKAAYQ